MPFLTEPGVYFSRIEFSGPFDLSEPFEYVFLGEVFVVDIKKEIVTRVRTNEIRPIAKDSGGFYFTPFKL